MIVELDETQFRNLGVFINSDIANTNEKIRTIYDRIAAFYPDLEHEQLNKEQVYPFVFPNEPFDDRKLRAMMALTTRLVEQYLVWEELNNDKFLVQQLLLRAMGDRSKEKLYRKQLDKLYGLQGLDQHKDVQFYFRQHQLEEENYNYAVRKKDPTIGKSLSEMISNLDIYYLSKRLRYSCEILNRKSILDEAYDQQLLDTILGYLSSSQMMEVPIIAIYYQILLTFIDAEDDKHYGKLGELISAHAALFPQAENKVIYGYAMNYCIKKINTGHNEYLDEVFRLYKLLLQHDIIFEGKYMSEWDYKNIVTVGLRLNETEWTEDFINKYKEHLSPSARENAYIYNKANLSYYKKDYKSTMRLLQQVEFTDDSYLLSSRSLLIKSFYELEEWGLLQSQAEAFRLFLRRSKKISNYQKTIYKNLIRNMLKLSKYKAMGVLPTEKLTQEILTAKDIADSTWLKKKLGELS